MLYNHEYIEQPNVEYKIKQYILCIILMYYYILLLYLSYFNIFSVCIFSFRDPT